MIPSGSLSTAPSFVSTSAVQILAEGLNVDVNGNGIVTSYSPGTLIYAAADSSNNIHVYGLNLANATGATAAPTPTQIGNLSLALTAGAAISTVICADSSSLSASTNFLDPTTLFVVLHIAGTTGCNTTGDVWEVVHYSDSASTAPVAVTGLTTSSASPINFSALYQPSGALAGLAALDPGSGNLQLFADDTFTSPTTLVASVTSVSTLLSSSSPGTTLFLNVTTGAGQYVYRLPYSATTATLEYTAQGTLSATGVADDGNVYFTDTAAAAPTFGAVTTSGTLTGAATGTITGSGTAALSGNILTVTVMDDEVITGIGEQITTDTDAFTGTYSAGTFTATSGTTTATACQQVSGTTCAQTTLNSPTSYSASSPFGAVTAAGGGAIAIKEPVESGIVVIHETFTFAAGGGGSGTTEYLLQEPLAGGTPTQLYSSSTSYTLLGANDSVVVFYTSTGTTASLFTTPTNASSPASSATALGASSYTGAIIAGSTFMLPTTPGNASTSLVFLTVVDAAATPTTYASEALSPSGTVEQPLTSNSAFLYFAASPLSGSVLQVRNIDTSGGYGGSTLYNVSAASLAGALGGTAFTTTGAAAYTVPEDTIAALIGLSNSVGAGVLEPVGGGTTVGLAYSLSQNLIVPISLSNTNITLGE